MREWISLCEKYVMDVYDVFSRSTEVFENPTAVEFGKILRGCRYSTPVVRGNLYADDRLLVWDAEGPEHSDVDSDVNGPGSKGSEDRFYERLFIQRGLVQFYSIESLGGTTDVEIEKTIRASAAIRRIIGTEFRVEATY